jgi:hypothetical protein
MPISAEQLERRWFTGLFLAALIAHVCFTFYHVKMPFLVGHEFRQSQTALITYYIDKENNFSPFYEQPILGKPWVAFMLEFPLYQWSVVGLSRATGWPHFLAARAISIASFYLALPAIALLLGRIGLTRPRRLFVLALLLVCPVYIFYTRAFLIDAMEWMFSAWFVAGFVRTMDRRDWRWLVFTIAVGTGAALVKNFIFAIWLMPAAAYGAGLLWRDLRTGNGWRAPLRTLVWGLGTVIVPLAVLRWWLAATDALKAAHPSAWIFTSKNLSQGNWGLFKFDTLFSADVWRTLLQRWSEAIMPPWLILAGTALVVIALPRVRWRFVGIAGVFFLSQVLFPFAYAYQDYYYYSCAAFLVVGFGLALLAVWESAAPRWLVAALIALPLAAQVWTYWTAYRPYQAVVSEGWTTFTLAVKDTTPPGSVIAIAGNDWAPMIPYCSERRALMIRNGLEYDRAYLERAFKDLADEDVAALVVCGKVRENRAFLDYAIKALDLEDTPTFRQHIGDVYLRRFYVQGAKVRLRNGVNRYGAETLVTEDRPEPRHPYPVSRAMALTAFPLVTPAPFQCDLEFGWLMGDVNGQPALSAHADTVIWLRPEANAHEIVWEFGLYDDAWKKSGDKTNGVECVITGEMPNGETREIFRRVLDPVRSERDRGVQRETIAFFPRPGEMLRFATLSNGSKSFDWAYWKRIDVR